MTTIIRWTLRQRRWSILWWCVGILAFIFVNLVFYPTFKDQASQFNETFEQLPQAARQLFTDTGDFFSPIGYLSSQIYYLMLPLLLGVLAIGLGSSLVGKEEREGTLEMLLARPISRAKLIFSKSLVGILILTTVGLLSTLFIVLMCKVVGIDVSLTNTFLAGLVVILLAVSFGAVAFTITMLGRGAKGASVGLASLIALGGYILVSLSGTVSWLHWPAKVLPFNYYHSSQLLQGTYNWANLLYFAALIVGCGVISWIAFRRRDING